MNVGPEVDEHFDQLNAAFSGTNEGSLYAHKGIWAWPVVVKLNGFKMLMWRLEK